MPKPEQKTEGCLNSKTTKSRSTGLRQVSIKNSPMINPFIKANISSKNNQPNPYKTHRQDLKSSHTFNPEKQPEIISNLLLKCLKPQTMKLQQNRQQKKGISRVRAKTQASSIEKSEDHEKKQRINTIRIGSKGQKYKQHNKSQPKKVFHFDNLCSSLENKQQKHEKTSAVFNSDNFEAKKTERKNNPNIFLSSKNLNLNTDFAEKLKKFNEDLKKTKKQKVIKLELTTPPTKIISQQTPSKGYFCLKNHQLKPKIEPFVMNDIKISPSVQYLCNQVQSYRSIPTASKFLFQGNTTKRNEINALERTRKIVNCSLQQSNKATHPIQAKNSIVKVEDQEKGKDCEQLISKEDIEFVLEKLGKTDKRESIPKKQSVPNRFQQNSITSVYQEQPSFKISQLKSLHPEERLVSEIYQRQLENLIALDREADTLRTTDYVRSIKEQQKAQFPEIERRKSLLETKQKAPHNKLRNLNEGAKTIVTRYDSSSKRSVIEESIILFQCSKDLKASFIREAQNGYASKYRGSLGVQALINQQEQNQMYENQNLQESVFENILASSSCMKNKFRKSHSIKQVQSWT